MAIYHVTREWDGGDLRTLAQRIDDGEMGGLDDALEVIAAKWTAGDLRKAEEYLDRDGRQVHCHATLDEAIEFRNEWCVGGEILSIDDEDLRTAIGAEYPHPIVDGSIPAELISVVDVEVA